MSTDKHDPLDIDVRAIETQWGIHITDEFLKLTEKQMAVVMKHELESLETTLKLSMNHEQYLMDIQQHETFYEEGILPTLRYSHVVLLYILVETRLRAFCLEMKKEKKLPEILPSDFRGGPIDQIQIYLKKLVRISLQELGGWDSIRDIQKVRDCIVHLFGVVSESRDKEYLQKLSSKNSGIQIDGSGKLSVEATFCATQIKQIEEFFDALFLKVGWRR